MVEAASATPRLVILDDYFPNIFTGFRVAEYTALLDAFPGAVVASASADFHRDHAVFARLHPEQAARVVPWQNSSLEGVGLAYLNFLNNASAFLPSLEGAAVPFVFTLYPGGGLALDDQESDAKLRRVLASPMLRAIVVTQPVTMNVVRRLIGETGERSSPIEIAEITGGIANSIYFDATLDRTWFGAGKSTLDVAFVAHKYMPRGRNKGFDVFVEAIEGLVARCSDDQRCSLRVHVVGNFDQSDWQECAGMSEFTANVVFHDLVETFALVELMADFDVVVSPNVPFVLHPGNFDGFPTGCCLEGSLRGAVMMATDPLDLGTGLYEHEQTFIEIEPKAESVIEALLKLVAQPARIKEIGLAGRNVSRRVFDPRVQVGGRVEVLRRQLIEVAALPCEVP